jgi:dTDP-4-dehydrorhamnose 3,5-epimerase
VKRTSLLSRDAPAADIGSSKIMGRFNSRETSIPGLVLVQRQRVGDKRGFLDRLFCREELGALLGGRMIAQINHTYTGDAGILRGMHFQRAPHAEMKLVTCLRGAVFDVAIDLRRDSPTLLKWHAECLSAENQRTLVIPEGFAHGFQTITDDCEMLYLHTAGYHPDAEGGIDALDPRLGITWPLPSPKRSSRDLSHALLGSEFAGI